ncbi:MFS transporter [Kutzneria sp. CA-103260]|uniref:MFS transporter n=1 Tax=Kutzneria sp. CA-103260 TaxID=2802641 RepID=UPI001BA57737|nr:MFS transporter [Kutzneria sp. CA-103260]QUQ67253.1 major facilitator superfamily transporter [Kutzneria sp. CA-103260]
MGGRLALLVALGIDNFGSGLFLPLSVLYGIQVVGLPVELAGSVVTAGKLVGIAAPLLAGRLVDRFGPRQVVIAAQVVQAAGVAVYLVAGDAALVFVASALLAAGQQAFYSSVFALIADTTRHNAKDTSFALVGAVRGVCFGLGGLVVAGLTTFGSVGYQVAVAADGVTFLAAAAVLAAFLPVPHIRPEVDSPPVSVLRNRPYLVLIVVVACGALVLDLFLDGIAVYVTEVLHGPAWVAGAMITTLTVSGFVLGTVVVRWTRTWWRTKAMRVGYGISVVWAAASLAAVFVPASWLPAYLLATMVLLSAGTLIGNRANALSEAAAPRATRGRYLAAFQYAFTSAGIAAPGVVALFAFGPWLPWLVAATAATIAAAAIPYLERNLPQDAVRGDYGRIAST